MSIDLLKFFSFEQKFLLKGAGFTVFDRFGEIKRLWLIYLDVLFILFAYCYLFPILLCWTDSLGCLTVFNQFLPAG